MHGTKVTERGTVAAATAMLTLASVTVPMLAQIAVRKQGYVPFSEEPINYLSDNQSDPVARLQQRIDRGEVSLEYEPRHGYLKSVLEKLAVPVSSQTLAFSKTSFQFRRISPQTPRALFFNDEVYVGQVHDGKAIEIVSFDPMRGAIFYLLDEHKVDRPAFQRTELAEFAKLTTRGRRTILDILLATKPGFVEEWSKYGHPVLQVSERNVKR
jgi:hypothetical protein